MKIAVFFVGVVEDAGFNASALRGAERIKNSTDADISLVTGVEYDQESILPRLEAAARNNDGVVFIGGQGDIATPKVARDHPDKLFAIIQGHHSGPNLASYDVRQEDSAFLAGVLAARTTKSGVVGHLSGHRVRPGLKGRAAFAAGVAFADPTVKLLTGFCGTQDDNAVTYQWTKAEIQAGADVIFTMLNGARTGAIQACDEAGVRQIGNALDWVERRPETFLASAVARIDLGVEKAISDILNRDLPDEALGYGLADGDFVRLSLSETVSSEIQNELELIAGRIRNSEIVITDEYEGPEFCIEEKKCEMPN